MASQTHKSGEPLELKEEFTKNKNPVKYPPRVFFKPCDFLSSVLHKGQIKGDRQPRSPFTFVVFYSMQ